MYRFRRLRRDERIRALMQETRLHPKDFIYPLFVIEGEKIKMRWIPCRVFSSIPLTVWMRF